jgi:glycosyltransferase involved in cell wall biosynthesis
VDDGSTDDTREKLAGLRNLSDIHVVLHERNQGKCAALRTGFKLATVDIIVVLAAILRYNLFDRS